jgi:DNA repair protein RecO (recombination protein O)
LGIKPVIDSCVSCGKTTDIVTISSYKGGYLCKECLDNEAIVTDKTLKLIRMFYYVDISKITKLEISPNIKKEINNFINDYYDRYSGIYLKSKNFIDTLNRIS